MSPRDELSSALGGLPSGYHTVDFGPDAAAVAGPTGVFLLVAGPPDLRVAAARAASLASSVRDVLAEQLGWVPFVDALVVADTVAHADGATIIPGRLLDDTLRCGPVLLDETAAAAVADAVMANRALATSA